MARPRPAVSLRSSVLAGLAAGAVAGLTLGLLILAFVNPIIREAEGHEPPSDEPPVVSDAQRDAGTLVGGLLFGAVAGTLLGAAAPFLRAYYPPWTPTRWGLFLGAAAFLLTSLLPALYHPPLPPAVEATPEGYSDVAAGTPVRQIAYAAVLLADLAGFALATLVGHRFLAQRPRRVALGLLAAAASFLGVAVLPHLLAPRITYVSDVPDSLVREFQAASLSVRLVFWLLLGWSFGILQRRWVPAPRGRSAAA